MLGAREGALDGALEGENDAAGNTWVMVKLLLTALFGVQL